MNRFDLATLKEDVNSWVYNWVSVYNPALEAVPCPFAKQAIVDNKIVYCYCVDRTDVEQALKNLAGNSFDQNKEVLIIGIDPATISVEDFQSLTADANNTYLGDAGFIALEDHPMDIETINHAVMNQGKWALLLVQAKSKLDKASAILEKQGYYKNWSKENLDDVVNWRKKT